MHAAATWPGRAALSMSSCPAATPGPGGGADDCVHDPAPNAIIPPCRSHNSPLQVEHTMPYRTIPLHCRVRVRPQGLTI
jgi:hypothetical protein